MTLLVTLLTVAVAVLTLLVIGLLRSHATILRRLHELGAGIEEVPVGDPAAPRAPSTDTAGPRTAPGTVAPSGAPAGRPAHDLNGVVPDGEVRALRVAGVGQDTILAFLSTGCTTCADFWDQLHDPQLPERTRLVVVTKGPEEESPAEVAALTPPGVTVLMSSRAWEDYEVPGSPYVIHVEGLSGRVRGEGTGGDWPQVRRMLLQAAGDRGAGGRGKAAADARREQEIDRALLAAGVAPGDPSLYRNAQQLTEDLGEPS
jgi:hypothetical protein